MRFRIRPRRRRTKIVVYGLLLLVVLGLAATAGIGYSVARVPLPDAVALPQQISLTYADGTALDTVGTVNRVDVPLTDVPVPVRDAVLAAEDRNFYHEPAISIRGIGRALVADISAGKISQGGSTITQQYVKNTYLTQRRTVTRKVEEIVLALKAGHTYSKDQILDFYLNTIYLGRGAYGIGAASEAYFGRPVSALSAAQGAVIAGLIRAPSVLDPAVSPVAARTRWQEVVDTMGKQGWLTAAQLAAIRYPAVLAVAPARTGAGPVSYIDDQVKAFLVRQFGSARVALGGLTVTTTISRTAQAAAEAAVAARLTGAPAGVTAALVSLAPGSGAVTAYYAGARAGGTDEASTQTAPPGSSFKPIVLAQALTGGTALSKRYSGASPQTFDGTAIRNFNNEQFGYINLPTATAESVNTVYVHLGLDTGLPKIVTLAHAMGIRSDPANVLSPTPDLPLGPDYVRAVDMAQVYATFADGGVTSRPYFVAKVTDRNGHVLFTAVPKQHRVLTAAVVANATYAMQQVLLRGTAVSARLSGGRAAAGKTGTTSGNISAWFDGFTPQLSTVVGVFHPDHGTLLPLVPWTGCACGEVTGGTVPAAIWKAFTDVALAGQPDLALPKPEQVSPADTTVASPGPTSSPTTPMSTGPSTPAPRPSSSRGPSVSPSAPPSTRSPTPSVSVSVPVSSPAPASSPAATAAGRHAAGASGPDSSPAVVGRSPP